MTKFKRIFFIMPVLLLAATLTIESYAQGSQTVRLLGRFHRYPSYAGVWGYVDSQSREYALIGTRNGTSIVNVTDPMNPVEVAFIGGPSSTWREIQTYSTYAYVTTEGGGGVQVIDLSDLPISARLAGVYNATVNNAHTLFIDRATGYAYINGATRPPGISLGQDHPGDERGGMNILNLINPISPVEAGVYSERYVHDSFVRNNVAYTSELGNGFSVVDVSDQSNPRVLATRRYTGAYTHNAWLTEDGSYLLTTDEILRGGRLRVWDIRNLGNIFQAGEYTTNPLATIHNVLVSGDFAYASYYAEGLRVIDITDPTLPVEAGYYDTHPEWVDGFRGAWGCYPFLPSGSILISDIQTGLWVFSFDGTRAGRLRGVVIDAVAQQPIEGATIRLQGNNAPAMTNSRGEYGTGYLPGTYRLTVSKPGYRTVETDVTLVSGRTVNLDVSMIRDSVEPLRVVLSRDASSNLRATVTITNPLPDPVPGVQMILVRASTLDGASFVDGVPVPQSFGTINPGQSVTAAATFPGTAGVPSGFTGLVRVDLSYTGGTYTEIKQVVTP